MYSTEAVGHGFEGACKILGFWGGVPFEEGEVPLELNPGLFKEGEMPIHDLVQHMVRLYQIKRLKGRSQLHSPIARAARPCLRRRVEQIQNIYGQVFRRRSGEDPQYIDSQHQL